ncbi:hypothetical protein [Roseateles sp.]|uniref:hypothetical protein n=1 Tax=Roseateles sp. TaxID=1971397 RepID=UPI0031D1F44F
MRPPFRLRVCASALILFASHAWALTPSTPAAPSEWKELDGQYYRLDANGDFSCYSEDAWNCKAGAPSRYPELVRPLSCGRDAQAKWGVTGYDTRGHWCNTAHAKLFARWQDYDILGLPVLLATNANGDPMCASANGRKCAWGEERGRVKRAEVVPLACGQALLKETGFSGYEDDQPDHWCQSPEIMEQQLDPPVSMEFAPGSFDLETRLFSDSTSPWRPSSSISPSTISYEFPTVPGLPSSDIVWAARLKSQDSMRFHVTRRDGRVTWIDSPGHGLMTVRIQPTDDLQYWVGYGRTPPLFHPHQRWDDPSAYFRQEAGASTQEVRENQLTLTFKRNRPESWEHATDMPAIYETVVARKRPAPRISH